jgi:uncharacterized protein YgbK (DUF1537 family)
MIIGGDVSGTALSETGATGLLATASLSPGAPLCQLIAPGHSSDGLEVVLKGGQMGTTSTIVELRDGTSR